MSVADKFETEPSNNSIRTSVGPIDEALRTHRTVRSVMESRINRDTGPLLLLAVFLVEDALCSYHAFCHLA